MEFSLSSSYCGVWFIIGLLEFDISSLYCGVWFVVSLLRCGVIRGLIAILYLYDDNSNKQGEFD